MAYYPSSFGSYPMPVQPTYTPPQPTNGIIKVNGPNSALQYSLPPNSMSPALFDSNGQVFYVVSTDGTGTKTIETFDFSPHVEPQNDEKIYVTKAEFDKAITYIKETLNGIHGSVQSAAELGEQAK